ncbi:MAG: DUF1566 domain-containing protein [Desulfococcaceae bacterium]|jgi:hypothetical protein|nr:DUF1566 domain-containing protein [Desulfococcaceae bacterium]
MRYENINAGTVNTFTGLFEQYAEILAGLKFQISRMKSDVLEQSSELQDLVNYCRQEMTVQEVGHCRDELGSIQKRITEEERKRQEELNRKEEERKKREVWLIANNDGTVTDPRTGLMWADRDNGHDINWHDAKKYCESYRGGGNKGWRIPTEDELMGLYQSGNGYNANGYTVYTTDLIHLSGFAVWASKNDGSSAAGVYFVPGLQVRFRIAAPGFGLALPVRTDKYSFSDN